MNTKHVYLVENLDDAAKAVGAARRGGIAEDGIALIARHDIELDAIPEGMLDSRTDFAPAALQGAAVGGATGLVAGLIAIAIPPIGMTLIGAAAVAAVGALAGTWSSAMMGSALPDPVRRKFEAEVESGRILLVIDGEDEQLNAAGTGIIAAGGIRMPFEEASALS
ncbi:MAG: hypothetical protein DCF27_02450 [Lysobacteraceae bacterium]|nr:MAG: hypothetical protein DCF27_02450 [Xanthomonadaceae bacterium]